MLHLFSDILSTPAFSYVASLPIAGHFTADNDENGDIAIPPALHAAHCHENGTTPEAALSTLVAMQRNTLSTHTPTLYIAGTYPETAAQSTAYLPVSYAYTPGEAFAGHTDQPDYLLIVSVSISGGYSITVLHPTYK